MKKMKGRHGIVSLEFVALVLLGLPVLLFGFGVLDFIGKQRAVHQIIHEVASNSDLRPFVIHGGDEDYWVSIIDRFGGRRARIFSEQLDEMQALLRARVESMTPGCSSGPCQQRYRAELRIGYYLLRTGSGEVRELLSDNQLLAPDSATRTSGRFFRTAGHLHLNSPALRERFLELGIPNGAMFPYAIPSSLYQVQQQYYGPSNARQDDASLINYLREAAVIGVRVEIDFTGTLTGLAMQIWRNLQSGGNADAILVATGFGSPRFEF